MVNFTGGLIRNPHMNSYINPDKVVNFSDFEGATTIEFTNGKVCELEDLLLMHLLEQIFPMELLTS